MNASIGKSKYVEKYEITVLIKLLVLCNYNRVHNSSIYSIFKHWIKTYEAKTHLMHIFYSQFNRSRAYIRKSTLPFCSDQSELNTPDLVI